MRNGLNFKKFETPKSPPGSYHMDDDKDVRTRTRKGSLWSESSYETLPMEPKQRTDDRGKDESGESNY